MAASRVGQQELSQRCGISVATLRAIQHGAQGRQVQNKTLAAISRALDRPEDHLIRMLVQTEESMGQESDAEQVRAIMARIKSCLREMNEHLANIERAVTDR
jgi:transcriptional regulator with XRE-family HTH domain